MVRRRYTCRIECVPQFWTYTAWSAYDATCGPARRTRTATCDNSAGGGCLYEPQLEETRDLHCSCPVSALANAGASSDSVVSDSVMGSATYRCNQGYNGADVQCL